MHLLRVHVTWLPASQLIAIISRRARARRMKNVQQQETFGRELQKRTDQTLHFALKNDRFVLHCPALVCSVD